MGCWSPADPRAPPTRNQVLDFHAHVGNRDQQGAEEREHPLLGGRNARHTAEPLDEVVRYQGTEPGDVSFADPVVRTPHRRSVVHGRAPLPVIAAWSLHATHRADGGRGRHHSIERCTTAARARRFEFPAGRAAGRVVRPSARSRRGRRAGRGVGGPPHTTDHRRGKPRRPARTAVASAWRKSRGAQAAGCGTR